ncbi:Hypothetical predicted protein [Paramuricea clavata]|uniref:Uncharacterized protein n=1 Tax=Paramuricea clavata TaxID=317549 RepID=A0A6S7GXH4_PARCT|nr:Hypothetical predicted protein [Paramuricea clavata]
MNTICASRDHNPKRFWSFFKTKSKVSNIPGKVSMKENDNERLHADNNTDIANMFNEYFASIFTSDPDSNSERQDHSQVITIDNIALSEEEVMTVIMNLDSNKAQGPDNIPARLLKETAMQITPSLCALFNKSLRVGVLPSVWKLANVVPVHKHGEKTYVENYRPISLLSLISKVLERCIFNNIKYHVYEQINPCQNGFMPGKSCITQLIEVLEQIGRELDRGKQIDVLYLDMSKAFDRVSHVELIHRLREFGFGGSVLDWFNSYLTNRYQQTTVLEATSKPLPVTLGVPQGSILGSLLFLLYENHLSNAVTNSNIATFADNTKIFKTINSISDAAALQCDLSKFEKGSTNGNLELNASKCKVLRVTRKHNKIIYPYTLHNTILGSTDSERDLGILTSSSLTWSKHVEYQYAKASKTLGYIRRSTFDIKDIAVRRTLYLTLVRTQLCYGSQIWAPQIINLIQRTERLQRRATNNESYSVEANEIDHTIINIPALDRIWLQSFDHFSDIDFPHRAGPVDLIIGIQYSHLNAESEVRQGLPFQPVGKRTKLGWHVIGPDNAKASTVRYAIFARKINLEKFYDFETFGVRAPNCSYHDKTLSRDGKKAIELFESSCVKLDERYVIGLPWKKDSAHLPNNYSLAKRRLESSEKNLAKNPNKAKTMPSHRFLWRIMETSQEPSIYVLLRVTFGDKHSPDMASFVMLKIAEESRVRSSEASKILERDRYVDNLIYSFSSTQGALQRIVAIEKMLNASGFKIKEWNCSSSLLRAQLNERKNASNPDTSSDDMTEPKEDSILQTPALKPVEEHLMWTK